MEKLSEQQTPLSHDELLDILKEMIKNIENLPQGAMLTSINHYDLYSFMYIVYSILKNK